MALRVERQRSFSFDYDGLIFKEAIRVDLLVEGDVVVDIKSAEGHSPYHFKQLLTYLRLLSLPVGLLINFGLPRLKDGLHRVANSRALSAPLRLCAHQNTAATGAEPQNGPRLDR